MFRPTAQLITLLTGGALFLLLIAIVAYPSLTLVYSTFVTDDGLSLSNYGALLTDADALPVLWNTLVVALFTTLGATPLGVLLAWLMERVRLPFQRLWNSLLIVPYLIPPFIGAIAWVYLLGPVGYLNRLWMDFTGTREPFAVIYGSAGIIFVMILYSYPIAYFITRGPMRQLSGALEEAARISGARPLQVLTQITLPLLLPNIAASAVLIFMAAMANFGIPAVIGFPARYFVLTNEIYQVILNFDRPNNLQIAAAMSMQLVLIGLLALLVLQRLQAQRDYTLVTGKSAPALPLEAGRWKYVAMLLVVFIVLVAVVLPLLAIGAAAITRAPGVPLTLETASLRHFETLFFDIPKVPRAFVNSFLLAGGAATLIAILSLAIGYLTVRLKMRGSRLMDLLVTLPYALPETVVALAMILTFLRPLPVLGVTLYNTIWILVIAYVASFLAFGVRSVSAAFRNIDPALEEAARISGAGRGAAFRDVTLPLIRESVLSGWFLAFMPALTELTLSALLVSVGNETIGQVVFGFYQEGRFNVTAALAFTVTVMVLVLSLLVNRFTRRRDWTV
jgi:iron(III) transport system permease protein